ncbi:20006_t:CDS:2, partial [Funneliformis geosporum]
MQKNPFTKQQSDFQLDKKEEHARYIRNLSNVLKGKQVDKDAVKLAGDALATFVVNRWVLGMIVFLMGVQRSGGDDLRLVMNEKKSELVKDFWKNAMSSQKRKVTAISEHTVLMEEHTTNVVSSVFQQDQIVRGEYARCLGDTHVLGDNSNRSEKRQRHETTSGDGKRRTPERQVVDIKAM